MIVQAVTPDRFLERAQSWATRYQIRRSYFRAAAAHAEALRPPVGAPHGYLLACRAELVAWRRFDAVAAELDELLREGRDLGSRAYMQVCRLVLQATGGA